jgi:hypothetical protein
MKLKEHQYCMMMVTGSHTAWREKIITFHPLSPDFILAGMKTVISE